MRGFLAGAVLGAALGVGGTYAALERPWQGDGVAVEAAADAGAVVDDGKGKRSKRRKRPRRRGGGEAIAGDVIPELSARDRSLSWRGPAVSLPPRDMDFGGEGGGRPLNQGEISAGIASGRDQVIDCIAESRGNAELRASITLEFLVEADGSVGALRLRAPNYLLEHGLQTCVTRAVRSMRFDATGAATKVTLPLELS